MKVVMRTLALALVLLGTVSAVYAGPPLPPAVPEIDPSMATGALSLLVGGVLILMGRRGK